MPNQEHADTPDTNDELIQVEVEQEIDAETVGPMVEISWSFGQPILTCESSEDADLLKTLLVELPAKVVVRDVEKAEPPMVDPLVEPTEGKPS